MSIKNNGHMRHSPIHHAKHWLASFSLGLKWAVFASAVMCGASTSAQAQLTPGSITRASSFQYNAQGLLIQEVIEPDTPQVCLTTTHDYDGFGNKRSVSTSACPGATGATLSSASIPRAASTTYSADGRFPAVTTNALGHSETKLYDSRFGSPTSLTGPNQLTTAWSYDGFGRKERETRSDGTWSKWSYLYCTDSGANCPSSLVAQGQGASAVSSPIAQIPIWVVTEQSCSAADSSNCSKVTPDKRQYHDALGRVIRVQTQGFDGGPGGGAATPTLVQDTEYNPLGQIRRKSNTYDSANPSAAVWVTYEYDALGRLIKEQAPDSTASSSGGIATTLISYNGLQSTITNSQGQSKTTVKDALGRTSSVTDTQGNVVTYQYDALGQLIQTDAAGNITRIQYNIRGQKTAMQDPAMGVWEYAYNAFGELVLQTDSLGQSASIEYDKLGRMTKRSEPDLTSVWVYDSCTKGVGKLCQASTLTGTGQIDYNRIHSYDAQGRTSTTATKLDTTVTTSVTYEANTGRVLSKSYPTGYQVSYQYTYLGFLKSVTGQGATGTQAGYTKEAKYEILAINAQGQITSYKYGNQVITNKTFDQQTGRLQSITATKEGLATGGIQQTTYQYDSLSNLTARGDVNSGVQETFGYDNLNRLTNYNAVGGSVTSQDASSAVQVMYDARGNITYKSDVGRYWYDPQRPNRLTNITLEAPAGAMALTGTRALSYAFDDYKAGARTLGTGLGAASGMVMGNGNLWYTVSQDNTTGRHSIRWETYTSFNMPKELALNNLGGAQTSTVATVTGSSCVNGTLINGNCVQTSTAPSSITNYSCPAGQTVTGNQCNWITTQQSYTYSNATASCPAEYSFDGNGSCTKVVATCWSAGEGDYCNYYTYFSSPIYTCPAGQTLYGGSQCQLTNITYINNNALATPVYGCPAGQTVIGTGAAASCQRTQTTGTPQPTYACPAGTQISGNRCFAGNITSSTVTNRTLTFTYGPEHQRIAQRTQLDATAPASMAGAAGITYYLNGQNNDLGYEKEVKEGGLIEHKHYLSAGGIVFAMQISRAGNLSNSGAGGTRPAQTLQYLHHDHLGSVAVVTDDTGSVVERLAYDPWGKRRFPNGTADTAGSIVGLTLDRGFTMHEHLDEMGVIHMNGRIYDPLIGRFMSADPFIQAPENLQSHNRFAYVMNNPLSYTDPSGYFSLRKLLGALFCPICIKEWRRPILSFAIAYFTGQWVGAYTGSAVLGGAAGGFAQGVISGGNLQSGLRGAFSGGLFGLAGGVGELPGSIERYIAHAAAGCLSAVSGGGKCGSGATSAVFGKYTTNWIGDNTNIQGDIAKGIATTVAGGIGSVIAGGKFENGAVTAAFGYLFNHCSGGKCTTALEQKLYDWMPGYKAGTLLYNQTMGDGSWTGWEVVDAASLGVGVAGKGISMGLNGGTNSVFWSGRGAMEEAAALGTTLEKTPIGSALNALQQRGIGSRWVWEQASSVFATNAAGTAQVVVRYNNPASIFYRTELPILQRNGVLIQPR